MKHNSIILTFILTECYSFVTVSLDEIEKNNVDELSDTTQSHSLMDLSDDKERLEEQKSWEYPEKSKQVLNPEGQIIDRLFSESGVPRYEEGQWINQIRLLLIVPFEEEARLKDLHEKCLQTVNETLWRSPISRDKLVLMEDANIFGNFLDSLQKINAIHQDNVIDGFHPKSGSLTSTLKYERDVYETVQLARIRYFFEDLCRKHQSMLSKLSIEHNHYSASESKEPEKISIFGKM